MNEVIVHSENQEIARQNFVPATVDKKKLFKALNTAKPASELKEKIKIEAVMFGEGQVTDPETGEVRDMESCTFITKQGSFITFSPTLLNSFVSALKIWGNDISKETFKIDELKSSKGRKFFVLDVL